MAAQDRLVSVTNRQFQDAAEAMQEKDRWVKVIGTDVATKQTVMFQMNRAAFLRSYTGSQRRPKTTLAVSPRNVISVR